MLTFPLILASPKSGYSDDFYRNSKKVSDFKDQMKHSVLLPYNYQIHLLLCILKSIFNLTS